MERENQAVQCGQPFLNKIVQAWRGTYKSDLGAYLQ